MLPCMACPVEIAFSEQGSIDLLSMCMWIDSHRTSTVNGQASGTRDALNTQSDLSGAELEMDSSRNGVFVHCTLAVA